MTERVTIAVLSWNRLHYLRATLESARRCIRHPDLEWIVSDNESREPGLREYIESLDWVQNKWFKTQTHAEAMNEIVRRATGRFLILWPDDMQFVVEGDWLARAVQTLAENPWIGSLGLNFLRRGTLRRLLGPPSTGDAPPILAELRRRGTAFRRPRAIREPINLRTFGWRLPGVIASGIPSLTRRECWQELGPWHCRGEAGLIDSSLGAEDDMIARFQTRRLNWQQATLMRPVAADIINDEKGCKAKVRQGRRFGRYAPPGEGDFYYEIVPEAALPGHEDGMPLSFESFVRPRGFSLPVDAAGNLLKASINTDFVTDISPAPTT